MFRYHFRNMGLCLLVVQIINCWIWLLSSGCLIEVHPIIEMFLYLSSNNHRQPKFCTMQTLAEVIINWNVTFWSKQCCVTMATIGNLSAHCMRHCMGFEIQPVSLNSNCVIKVKIVLFSIKWRKVPTWWQFDQFCFIFVFFF